MGRRKRTTKIRLSVEGMLKGNGLTLGAMKREWRGTKGRWIGLNLQRRTDKGRHRCIKGDEPMLKCDVESLKGERLEIRAMDRP